MKDKVAIVECYVRGFVVACSKQAGSWYFVDGLAGPGINRIQPSGQLVWGSPLIALRAEPAFTRCLLMDLDAPTIASLNTRTAPFGNHAVPILGDVNEDLLPAMREVVNRYAPCLCLLDPEGTELRWTTIDQISRFRRRGTKVELLILFPTDTGFVRMLPVEGDIQPWAEAAMLRVFGSDDWRDIWQRRRRGELTPDDARTEYVRLYARRLQSLGYKHALDREIRTGGRTGRLLYFLIFATDHDVGRKIMDHCFDQFDDAQMTLFPMERAKRL